MSLLTHLHKMPKRLKLGMKLKVLQLLVNADGPEKMERSNSFMDQDDCTLPISSPNITK